MSRIRADDQNGLEEAAKSPLFSLHTRITPTLYTPSSFLQGHPTLVQVAAFFGAVNCFKWFVMNGADLFVIDHTSLTVAQFAVAGGNIEIIRLCQQSGLNFFGTLHTAIKFHRNTIFDWLFESGCHDPDNLDADGQNCLHAACESNNLYALARCLHEGTDPNLASYRGWTPLRIAVRRGHKECVRMLLATGRVFPDPRTENGVTPLHLAAKHGAAGEIRGGC
jgi:ankyrin repeat protein